MQEKKKRELKVVDKQVTNKDSSESDLIGWGLQWWSISAFRVRPYYKLRELNPSTESWMCVHSTFSYRYFSVFESDDRINYFEKRDLSRFDFIKS